MTSHGPAWLRLQCTRTDRVIDTFWNGNVDAQRSIPASIPKPRLLGWHDWTNPPWAYRAELYEHVGAPPIWNRAILTSKPDLPKTWWTAVRRALEDLATVPTGRVTIHRGFFAWAMPYYLGLPHGDHMATTWSTAHGDFHYANLCGPALRILDWEGWGTAPIGYDAATLHCYSLFVPTVAARVRHEFADILDTDTGRLAELAVISELLHATTQGNNLELAQPLRDRAASLLDRVVPAVSHRPAGH